MAQKDEMLRAERGKTVFHIKKEFWHNELQFLLHRFLSDELKRNTDRDAWREEAEEAENWTWMNLSLEFVHVVPFTLLGAEFIAY